MLGSRCDLAVSVIVSGRVVLEFSKQTIFYAANGIAGAGRSQWELHHNPDHHSRSLLVQFGLTLKARRGLAAGDSGESLDAV